MKFDGESERSEFEWEARLRMDDKRLHSSMLEIPSVLDLPGENDLLRKRLQRRMSMVWKQSDFDFGFDDDFSDDDIIPFYETWRELPEAAVYDEVEALMRDWCAIYATVLPNSGDAAGIQGLCLYGRMLGFIFDLVVDMEANRPGHLKVALCKRLLKDMDRMSGIIDATGFEHSSLKRHKSRLKNAREGALRLLFQLRDEINGNK